MLFRLRVALILSMALPLALACGDDNGDGDGGASTDGGDGADGGIDGGGGMDAGMPLDGGGVVILDGGGILLPDGNIIPSGPATCQGRLYQCGDTIDNDGDGLVDSVDPDCLGPCDNNETGFNLGIPGGDSAPCRLDCYFDQDQGSGNDRCNWDHRCDPLEPDSDPACSYQEPPWTGPINCPDEQEDACEDFCRPLVPNGCDCFGCCNLPAGGDRWVFIGSVDGDGTPTCNIDDMEDDEACHPCTPVDNCLNDCGECELCLGRTELPPSCLPTPPGDAGTLPDGGPAPMPDGGLPDLCGDGRQTCGIPGAAACPDGFFCLTGCCTFFG
ncbi:MAG: hypothetical protein AB8I08_20140 [Sandaracinaceae bacterium]